MEYKIRFVPGNPKFDTLGVMKLSCDSSVDINSRIYGQARQSHRRQNMPNKEERKRTIYNYLGPRTKPTPFLWYSFLIIL